MSGDRIPPSFSRATWRATLPVDPQTGETAISFDLADGSVVRLRLSAKSARDVRQTLSPRYWRWIQSLSKALRTQSAGLSLRSSEPKSTPSEAEK